jgi:hypothetical protein
MLIFGVKHLGIYYIFAVLTAMALSYNPRGSTAYLYATEVLPPSRRLTFGTFNFTLDGIFSITAACYFYYVGDVNSFFIVAGLIFTLALIAI